MTISLIQTGCLAGICLIYFLAARLPDTTMHTMFFPTQEVRNGIAVLFIHDIVVDWAIKFLSYRLLGKDAYGTLQANVFAKPWAWNGRRGLLAAAPALVLISQIPVAGWYLRAS